MTPSSFEAACAIIARVRNIEALLDDEPFLTRTEWLLLPPAKQEIVLKRLGALREYDVLKSPTTNDALRAAKAAGIAITRFYQLLAHWRAHDRSPLSLVPHQSLGMERPTRLAAQETANAISASIRALLSVDPLAPTGRVISHVRRNWNGPGDLPSDTALRVFHERAIRSDRPAPGSLTLSTPGQPAEDDVVAERLAETLVIDHVSIKGLVAAEDGLQPTVTLAIDLWSGSPMGVAAMAGPPGPDGLIQALHDVAQRVARMGETDADGQVAVGAKPRLVIATTFAKQWAGLVQALLAQGFEIVERRDVFLHQGGPSRRLLGMRLGVLPLERRADRRTRSDWRATAVQPLSVIQNMLTAAVDDAARERVPPAAWSMARPFNMDGLADAAGSGQIGREPPPDVGRRRGRPPGDGSGRIRSLINRMAAARAPKGVKTAKIRQDGELVWHLTVTVGDPDVRDSVFIQLAEGAMQLSAEHHVPIVVDVEVEQTGKR